MARGLVLVRLIGEIMPKYANPIEILHDHVKDFELSFKKLVKSSVLVGVPAEKASRKDEGKDEPMNNAMIAYIQNFGAPEANIPAREFMYTGIANAKDKIEKGMKLAAQAALDGNGAQVSRLLSQVGMAAQSSIRNRISSNIPPPLQPGTIKGRKYSRKTKSRRKGEQEYLRLIGTGVAEADAQQSTGITALVNTGQLRNSINYVVKEE